MHHVLWMQKLKRRAGFSLRTQAQCIVLRAVFTLVSRLTLDQLRANPDVAREQTIG